MNKKQDGTKNMDFPLMLGGPLKPPLNLVKRRIIIVALIAWLPLLLLAFLGGTALSGVKVPFLFDVGTHIRLLVSIGLFIGSEVVAHQRLPVIVNQFIDRDIITPDTRARFDNMIASALKLRNSYVAAILLLILVYTVGHFSWIRYGALNVPTWYSTIINGRVNLTMAGYWYAYISIPLFQFILCRWYYRTFIWYRFLWQVSRLPLHLNYLHPDRSGGLGFLDMSISAFAIGLLAHTVLLAGLIANSIWHAGKTLLEFKLQIVSILLFLLFLVLTPLLFFITALVRTKQKGLVDYGMLAGNYVNDFNAKWAGKPLNNNEVLLGSADIQSLADLSNSFTVVKEMRVVPFNRNTIILLVLEIGFPILLLLLTIIPVNQMINGVIKLFL